MAEIYQQCKQFAESRGWFIDDEYYHQGQLVVGISATKPFQRKPCFSYPHSGGRSLESLLDWVERCLS